MLTVACCCVPGGIYEQWHVDRLAWQVKQYLHQPYEFTCITQSDKPGYWSKIDLFQPGRFSGRVLYLDLDVTVIGSLDDLANLPATFSVVENFKEIKEPNKAKFNSSVMAWDAEQDSINELFTEFNPSIMDRLNGDQDWISEQLPNVTTFPKDWCVSYKVRRFLKLRTMPKDARVVCYHGKPKPFDMPDNDLDGFTIV